MACGNYLRNRAIRSSCRSKRQWHAVTTYGIERLGRPVGQKDSGFFVCTQNFVENSVMNES